jgi:hypothetical protein
MNRGKLGVGRGLTQLRGDGDWQLLGYDGPRGTFRTGVRPGDQAGLTSVPCRKAASGCIHVDHRQLPHQNRRVCVVDGSNAISSLLKGELLAKNVYNC